MEYLKLFVVPAAIVAVISYLLGSISFSIIFTKIFKKHTDIRTLGSGNAGATNVLRSVGKLPALLTLIFDFGKGAVSVIIGRLVFSYLCDTFSAPTSFIQYGAYIAGFSCIMGHIFPVFFGFRGGKGVLTCAAMMAFVDWRVFLVELLMFLIIFLITKIVSLSSIIAACCYPITTFLFSCFIDHRTGGVSVTGIWISTVATFIVGAIIVVKHHSNIKRILHGEEKKIIGRSKKKDSKDS